MGAAVVAVGAAGCIGTIDRGDFDREIQERGGGFTSELPLAAVEAVADELGTQDVALRSLSVTPSSETVTMEVRDPAVPDNLDQYVVHGGEVDSVAPIRLSATDDLDAETFPASGLAFDRIEPMVDAALAEFDPGTGYVTSLIATQRGAGEAVFLLGLESPRASATATFSAAGELLEVTRS